MTLHIEKIQEHIGAVVHHIQLSELNAEALTQIKQALLQHQVLFFRQQSLTPQQHADFAAHFGQLHIHPIFPHIENVPEIIVLDSFQQDLKDNDLWHTDVTFSLTPPQGCVLHAIKIPPQGGDTFWSSATAAYAALPLDLQEKLSQFTAIHDIRKSFPYARFAANAQAAARLQEAFKKNPPVIHPVVRTHPVTGQSILFVNEGFTTRICELEEFESDQLLSYLFEHATQEKFHLRWQWQEGDVAIWDNQCTQHRALFDYGAAHRVMHRATILGEQPYYKQGVDEHAA